MRIGIIADPCDATKPGGLGRAIFEWVQVFIEVDRVDELTIYAKDPSVFSGDTLARRPLPAQVWLRGARALDPSLDLYIFFTPAIPLLFRPKRAIVVAADFAYLDLPQKGIRERVYALASYFMHRRSLRLASHVVCMSHATKESAVKHFGVAPQKCVVIPLAGMPLAPPEPVADLPERFFFFAGALKERKNVANLIRAFSRYRRAGGDASFLLAGKTGGPEYEALLALVRAEGTASAVRFLDYISDGQVRYLYEHALALVFASLVEGFGMPILEAMRAGCPVITADRGAVTEIAGDAALLADPHDPAAIAVQMELLSNNPSLRATLKEAGERQASRYSWQASAKALLEVVSAT